MASALTYIGIYTHIYYIGSLSAVATAVASGAASNKAITAALPLAGLAHWLLHSSSLYLGMTEGRRLSARCQSGGFSIYITTHIYIYISLYIYIYIYMKSEMDR